MKKSEEIFESEIKQVILPKLSALGFDRIILKDNWIYPKFLFEHNDIWFGASWDWKDNYLEIDLGRLFFFKDVLPRVIIIGTIGLQDMAHDKQKQFQGYQNYFHEIFTAIAKNLEENTRTFDAQYPEAYERRIKINEEIPKYLGRQVKRSELPCE